MCSRLMGGIYNKLYICQQERILGGRDDPFQAPRRTLAPGLIPWYIGTMKLRHPPPAPIVVRRVQTGVRIEKRILKVLKALATHHEISLGDLLEGVVLHAFEGKCAFSRPTLRRIAGFRALYGLDLRASSSHRLTEQPAAATRPTRRRRR